MRETMKPADCHPSARSNSQTASLSTNILKHASRAMVLGGLAVAGCAPSSCSDSSSTDVAARVARAALASPAVDVPLHIRRQWAAEPSGHDWSIEVDFQRRPVRIVAVPSDVVFDIPAATRRVTTTLSVLPTRPAPECLVDISAKWRHQLIASSNEMLAKDGWHSLPVEIPDLRGGELQLEIRPRNCGDRAYAAIGRLHTQGRSVAKTNVILVILDTVRRDRFDCAARARELMPDLTAQMCDRGVFFTNAWSTAPWTTPSIASMLTGLLPQAHGANRRDGRRHSLHPTVTTLAEILSWGGFATGAVIANPFSGAGMWRGFENFIVRYPRRGPNVRNRRRARGVINDAIGWLDRQDPPFFLSLLLIDAHQPVDIAVERGDTPRVCAGIEPLPTHWQGLQTPAEKPSDQDIRRLQCRVALYEGALSYIDGQLSRLWIHLRQQGLHTNTAILIVSDHGEELWDHAREQIAAPARKDRWGVDHGHTHHAELMHVSLLVVPPVGTTERYQATSGALVSTRDIFATVLGFAGIAPPTASGSIDLRAVYRGLRSGREHVIGRTTLYGVDRRSVTTNELRALWASPASIQIFDRQTDPLEHEPLPDSASGYGRGEELIRRLLAARVALPEPAADETEALRTLGYVR